MSRQAHRTQTDPRRPNGWRSSVFDGLVALLAGALEVGRLFEVPGDPSAFSIVLAVLSGVAVAARRYAPLPVLGFTLAATCAMVALGDDPSGLSPLIALFTTAATRERRVSLAALVPTVAVIVLVSFKLPADAAPGLETAVTNSIAVAGIWGLGAYLETRRRYLRELESHAAQLEREREQLAQIAVMEERASIARELHDIVAHSVTVMLLGVRGARERLHSAPDVADDTLARVEQTGERSVAELRRILTLLRDSHDGAESRPQPSLVDLAALVDEHRASGLALELAISGRARHLPDGVQLSIYRIVQEALTNVVKHAHANRVTVHLSYDDAGVSVEVTDDGAAGSAPPAPSGHGLVGMRERVALLGGTLEAGPRAGRGFRVAVRLPVSA